MKTATERRSLEINKIRDEFPALVRKVQGKELVYFDSACTALKPRCVAEALSEHTLNLGACGGKRSTHLLAQAVEEAHQQARQAVADFIGAESPNEIIFTSGTTEAVNLLARAFPYDEKRREVVLSDLEHNAVFLPFFEASRRGEIRLKFCRSRAGRVDPDDLKALIGRETALVALTRASNVYGGVQPMAEICRLAHGCGAAVLADDAQYLSSHREDVSALNVDFVAFSAHKLGGPFGIGVLYGKEPLLNRLRHYKIGGGAVKSVRWKGSTPEVVYLDAPMRFEGGVPNFAGAAGLSAAIRFLGGLPPAALREHTAGLVRRAAEGLSRLPQIRLLGEPGRLSEGSIVSFYPVDDRFSIADFNLFLNHELPGRFIALRAGEHCAHLLHQSLGLAATIRLSFFAYNTPREVDFFLEAIGAYVSEACS